MLQHSEPCVFNNYIAVLYKPNCLICFLCHKCWLTRAHVTFGRRDGQESWLVRRMAMTQLVDVWDVFHISRGKPPPHANQHQIAQTTPRLEEKEFILGGTNF